MRVYQWTKNLLVLAALIFAAQAHHPDKLISALIAFASFCLASSATYLFNDWRDRENDRAHPTKCKRPQASGEMGPAFAWILIVALFVGALALAWQLPIAFLGTLVFYIVLTLAYTLALKDVVIVDVMVVSLGFVTRALAGAVAIQVEFSNWLIVCSFFLALFLSLNKRRNELTLLEEEAEGHRQVLSEYSIAFLDQLILIVAGGAIITYTIYTCSPDVWQRLHTKHLYMTIPFVVYGLFRYLYLVHHRKGGGDPSSAMFTDWHLGLDVLLWGITCLAIIYLGHLTAT